MAAGDEHRYGVTVTWTGNTGSGTAGYKSYARDLDIACAGKPTIAASSDPAFRGDSSRWNPEDLLIGALSACHKLWYLHLCSVARIVVVAYVDHAEGVMQESATGGRFTKAVLRPEVTIRAGDDAARAAGLHEDAHARCFIANSLNFPVSIEPTVRFATA